MRNFNILYIVIRVVLIFLMDIIKFNDEEEILSLFK